MKLRGILTEADGGYMRRWAELCEDLAERYPQFATCLWTRCQAVAQSTWQLTPFDDTQAAIDLAADLTRQVAAIPSLSDRLADLLDGIGTGTAICENIWDTSTGQARVKGLAWVHSKRVLYDSQGTYGPMDALRVLTVDEPVFGVQPAYGQVIAHCPRLRPGYRSRAGLTRVAAWLYLLWIYGLKDMATAVEVTGIPPRIARTKDIANASVLRSAMADLGSDASIVLVGDDSIEWADTKGGAAVSIFSTYLNYLDSQVSKLFLGHGSAIDSVPGQLGAQGSSQAVRKDIRVSDAVSLAETLRTQLLAPIVSFNYPPEALDYLPYWTFQVEDSPNQAAMAQTDKALQEMGFPLEIQAMADRYGRALPAEGATILQPLAITTAGRDPQPDPGATP